MPEHPAARQWLDAQLASGGQVALSWESTTAFVRLVSNPRVFSQPATVIEAWKKVELWLAQPGVWIPTATRNHAEIVGELFRGGEFAANDLPDIHTHCVGDLARAEAGDA